MFARPGGESVRTVHGQCRSRSMLFMVNLCRIGLVSTAEVAQGGFFGWFSPPGLGIPRVFALAVQRLGKLMNASTSRGRMRKFYGNICKNL